MDSLFGSANISWYDSTAWRQDEGEFGYTRTPSNQTSSRAQSVILDTVNPTFTPYFQSLISTNKGWYGHMREALAGDGGDIDVSPPDTSHPYGRLIIGDDLSSAGMAFFEKQVVQCPIIEIPTKWLLVGHVDEVMAVIPSNSTYVVCVGDLTNAISILCDYTSYPTNELDGYYDPDLGDWQSRSNLVSVYTNAANAAAITEIQGYLDSAATNLATQLGVPIIRIPVAYTLSLAPPDGSCKTFLPNSVNAAVAKIGGTVKVGLPDPRFQPFRSIIASRLSWLSSNAGWIYCNDLNVSEGNAHCASNTDKAPPSP